LIYEPPAKCQGFTKDVKNALDTIAEGRACWTTKEAPKPPECSEELEKKNRRVSLNAKNVKKGGLGGRLKRSVSKMQATSQVLDLHARHKE